MEHQRRLVHIMKKLHKLGEDLTVDPSNRLDVQNPDTSPEMDDALTRLLHQSLKVGGSLSPKKSTGESPKAAAFSGGTAFSRQTSICEARYCPATHSHAAAPCRWIS